MNPKEIHDLYRVARAPVDIHRICLANGLELWNYSPQDSSNNLIIKYGSFEDAGAYRGTKFVYDINKPRAYVNKNLSNGDRRFMMAIALYHFLHNHGREVLVNQMPLDVNEGRGWALELLCPYWIVQYVSDHERRGSGAAEVGVSPEVWVRAKAVYNMNKALVNYADSAIQAESPGIMDSFGKFANGLLTGKGWFW